MRTASSARPRAPLFLLGLLAGLALAVGGALALATSACTGTQARDATNAAKLLVPYIPLPPGASEDVAAVVDAANREFAALAEQQRRDREAALAQGKAPPDERVNWQGALYSIVTAGAAVLAARKLDMGQAKTVGADLKDVAVSVGRLLSTPKAERSPEVIANTINHALPGEEMVTSDEVAAPAKAAA